MSVTPPRWAEELLRLSVKRADFETAAGDLLEHYRDSVLPVRGRSGADRWYVRQVFGFVWRAAWIWGVVFGGAVVARSALDWFAPPQDFYVRSTASTAFAVLTLIAAGAWTSWRSASVTAGAIAGAATTTIGAMVSILGSLLLLAFWHDAGTVAAVGASGGLGETFELPLLVIAPGVLLGTVGGVVGWTISRLRSA